MEGRRIPRSYAVVIILLAILVCLIAQKWGVFYVLVEKEYINSEESPFPVIEGTELQILYEQYHKIPRHQTEDYVAYILDKNDDDYLSRSFPNATISSVIWFIHHNITYFPDSDTEYPKYPVETLYEQKGDCEDKAILGASILALNGYNTSLILTKSHMLIGVMVNDTIDGHWEELIFDENGFATPEDYMKYDVSDRPIVFHTWGKIYEVSGPFMRSAEGKIYVYNQGTKSANVTLEISGKNHTLILNPFTNTTVYFKIDTDLDLITRIYYNGEIIDENRQDN